MNSSSFWFLKNVTRVVHLLCEKLQHVVKVSMHASIHTSSMPTSSCTQGGGVVKDSPDKTN